MRAWPESVERVARVLRAAGVDARLEEFGEGTPTAQDAARVVGCALSQIVKSLLLVADGRPVLALVPGDRRADTAKVAAAVGAAAARVARPDEVIRITGFAPGAVAPFPLPEVGRVLLERLLFQHELVWIGAGSANHMAGLGPVDLARLARAERADLIEA